MFQLEHELSKDGGTVFNYYPYFYYLYEMNNPSPTPIITVCLLISPEFKILARGVAIRSTTDPHNKKTGRNKSYGRAIKALVNNDTDEFINIETTNFSINTRCVLYDNFEFKSEFYPSETEKELQIIEKVKNIMKGKSNGET
jgi:hypothetical protein